MIQASKLEGKTLVFLKPCDTYSFNQLLKERRVDREESYIIGVGCKGKLDIEKDQNLESKGIESPLKMRAIRFISRQSTAEDLCFCRWYPGALPVCAKETSIKIYDELM